MSEHEVNNKLKQIQDLVKECEDLAIKGDFEFRLDVGGYGMGGTFVPKSQMSSYDLSEYGYALRSKDGAWMASSQSC